MKKRLILLFAALLTSTTLLADLWWADGFEEGLKQAKEEHKIAMVMFSSPTCGVCHYMKTTVFEDDRVFDYIQKHFIPIDIDVKEHPDKLGFEVYGFPTFYFLDGDGKWVAEPKIGGAKPDAFLRQLKAIVKAVNGER